MTKIVVDDLGYEVNINKDEFNLLHDAPDFLKKGSITFVEDLHISGAKDDNGKIMGELLGDFGRALECVAEVGTYGANKYTRNGWESVPDGVQRYKDALWRHLLKVNNEVLDEESGLPHLHMVAWNVLAVIELMQREGEV